MLALPSTRLWYVTAALGPRPSRDGPLALVFVGHTAGSFTLGGALAAVYALSGARGALIAMAVFVAIPAAAAHRVPHTATAPSNGRPHTRTALSVTEILRRSLATTLLSAAIMFLIGTVDALLPARLKAVGSTPALAGPVLAAFAVTSVPPPRRRRPSRRTPTARRRRLTRGRGPRGSGPGAPAVQGERFRPRCRQPVVRGGAHRDRWRAAWGETAGRGGGRDGVRPSGR